MTGGAIPSGLPLTETKHGGKKVRACYSRRDAEGGVPGGIWPVPASSGQGVACLTQSYRRDHCESTTHYRRYRVAPQPVLRQQRRILDESAELLRPQDSASQSRTRGHHANQNATGGLAAGCNRTKKLASGR